MKPPAKPVNPFSRSGPSVQTKSRYAVQHPVPLANRSQQIRATLNGTRQVAGSVDIRAIGPGKGFIANLKVDQQHRRRGVGAQLVDAAIATARRQGMKSVSLEARPSDNGISSQALVAMYRRQGFKSVGRSQRGNPLMERKL
ncbi:MAG TPA: N-acetyltransferase [Pyrinomonadaceae bacterium]|nr:N-acetyltransferase [Pyrinomonadaceae bacterium]